MPQYFIANPTSNLAAARWCLVEFSASATKETVGSLAELAQRVGAEPVTVLISAANIACLITRVAGRSDAQIKQAAPYVVEEELIDDVETLTFKVLDEDTNGLRQILAYDEKLIASLCDQFKDAGFRLSSVFPDAALLVQSTDSLTVLAGAEAVYFGLEDKTFARTTYELLPILLPRMLAKHDTNTVSLVIGADVENREAFVESVDKTLAKSPGKPNLTTQTISMSAVSYLVRHHGTELGDYAQYNLIPESMREMGKLGFVQRWGFALAAGIAALALALHIGLNLKSNAAKRDELSGIKNQQQVVFKQAFPEVKRIVNAEAQAQQLLQELQKAGPPPAEFLNVFYRSTELLANTDNGVKLVGFSFADGIMILRMESENMSRLEKYRGDLSGFLAAEVVSAESSDDVVRGAIRVRPD